MGVPIYWLNGAKAADEYQDFYDGSWDDEANDKNESGTDGPDTSALLNRPITGCGNDGTEAFSALDSRALGSSTVRIGRPNSSGSGHGPLDGGTTSNNTVSHPMYGLSEVFQVNNAPTLANAIPDQTATAGTGFSYQFPANTFNDVDTDTLSYTGTKADDTMLPTWLVFTASTRTFSGTPAVSDVGIVSVKVTATDTNSGTVSDEFDITVSATAPGAPTGLTATASGTTQINLSWTAPASNGGSAITGYKIEVSSDSGASWNDLVANTGSTTTYEHTGLTAGTTRHYRVSAINANGTSLPSNVDDATTDGAIATAPGAPTGLTATASGISTINLSWTAPASNGGSAITGYRIEASSDSGSNWSELVANTGNANTTYAHSALAGGTTRHYRVSAINATGTGLPSNVDDATTGASVPGVPTSLSATSSSGSTTINLSWTAPSSTGGSAITGYKIEVSSNGGSNWSDLVADTGNANTTYAHAGLADGATRHYRVSAINAVGTGPASSVDDATTGQTTVTFDASSYTAEESGAPATVTVELSEVPLSPVTIPLVVTHLGRATTGDYEGLPSSVTFWTTGRSRTFTVRATDDSDVDAGESVQIGFGPLPTGYAAGTPRTATVALVDDETELIVDFGTGAPSNPIYVRESDTDLHRITFSLKTSRYSAPDGNPQQPVTIPLVVTHRGGATPDDYEGLPSSVTFDVGESVTDFTMRAIPDRKVEIGEGLRLDFGPLPAGVRKGAWGPYETIEFVDEAAAQANLSVAGSLLTLVYREALDGASKPFPRDFVVTAQTPGGARAMVAVRAVSVRGSDVLLDLERAVTPEETVTLTYLAAAMHPIRDAAGLLAAPLADEPVRNETGIPPERTAVLDRVQAGARPGHLDLSSRNLTDLSALAGLSGVRELDLRDNAITDLSPLLNLSELQVLNLAGNRIEDIATLAGLTGLERLNLSDNRIEALSPLAGLENLGLSENRIADIGLLGQLGRLRRLDLSGNAVADVSALGEVSGLLWLRLPGNPVSDVTPLGRLEQLRWLWLDPATSPGMEAWGAPAGREAAPLWIERVPAQ